MSADAADRVPVPSHEEELTRQWLAQRHRQVRPARPASAVVLVRDGEDGVEVLLRHRAGRTPLGRIGFPGGSLVEADAHACPWFGPSPGEWAHTLGLADRRRVRQHVVAAVRELFEECGVLLAGASDMEVVQDARGETWGARRSSLEHGDAGLPQLLEERGLGLRTDLLRALGRWQSAPHSPRRFDTVVFTAALPPQQEPVPRPEGPDLQGWVPATRAVAEPMPLPGPDGWLGEVGRIALAEVSTPLTQLVLRDVARHRTAAGFLLSLGHGRDPVPHVRLRTEAERDDVATGALHTVAEPVRPE